MVFWVLAPITEEPNELKKLSGVGRLFGFSKRHLEQLGH